MDIGNIERLQAIADGLEELNDRVTYVGGSVTGLYAQDEAVAAPRPTNDVDCVVEYFSFQEKEAFEQLLREKDFSEDMDEGAPLCRWLYKKLEVDIMPSDDRYFHFTNRWYKPGIKSREPYTLPNGRTIYIMPLLHFIASKLEAIPDRGGFADLRGSQDFEDIIYVINACPDFKKRYEQEQNSELKNYIREQFHAFAARPNILEEIECALPMGEEERADLVLDIFAKIA